MMVQVGKRGAQGQVSKVKLQRKMVTNLRRSEWHRKRRNTAFILNVFRFTKKTLGKIKVANSQGGGQVPQQNP